MNKLLHHQISTQVNRTHFTGVTTKQRVDRYVHLTVYI